MGNFWNDLSLNWAQRIVLCLYAGFCGIMISILDSGSMLIKDYVVLLWPLTMGLLALLLAFKKNPKDPA